jgi:hypothetical protein
MQARGESADMKIILLGGARSAVSDLIPFAHGDRLCHVKGAITPLAPDKALVIRFSGSYHGRERYVFAHGRWTPRGPEPDVEAVC